MCGYFLYVSEGFHVYSRIAAVDMRCRSSPNLHDIVGKCLSGMDAIEFLLACDVKLRYAHYDRIYETARDTSIEVCVAVFYAQFTVFD